MGLKPSNIIVSKTGIKVLDFGLAKREHRLAGAEASQSATFEKSLTSEGTVVGTIQYMAPEVLQGKDADARSDVFALALVLYEMLSGKRAFEGATRSDVIAAVLAQSPQSLLELRPGMPPALDRLIHACLAKDPDDRLQTAHDVMQELQWIAEAAEPARPSRWKVAGRLVALVLFSLAVVMTTLLVSRRFASTVPGGVPASRVTRTTIDLRGAPPLAIGNFTPLVGYFGTAVALSPDGSELAYVGWSDDDTQIFRRALDREGVEPVPGTRGAREAFFSPDSQWLGVITSDKLLKIPHDGGPAVVLGNVRSATRGVWTRMNSIYIGDVEGAIIVHLTPQGEKLEEIDLSDVGAGQRIRLSDVLPDGTAAIVNISTAATMSGDFSGTGLLDLKTHKVTPLIDRSYDARYIDPGVLTFMRSGDLLAIPFNRVGHAVRGEPVLVASGVATNSFFRRSQYAICGDGSLAYVPGSDHSRGRIAIVDRRGRETFLKVPEELYVRLDLSPDNRFLATHVSDVKDYVSVFDLLRQEGRRLNTQESTGDPMWRSDGNGLYALMASPEGGLSLLELDAGGGRPPRTVAAINAKFCYLIGVSADNRKFVISDAAGTPIFLEPTADAGSGRVEHWPNKGLFTADLSPDGRWIAYGGAERGRGGYQIYVSSVKNRDEVYQISTAGGLEPVWCRACPELFYRNGDRWYSSHISTAGKFEWDPPREV